MKSKRAKFTWPVAACVMTFIVGAVVALVLMPPETARYVLGGEGLVAVLWAAYLRSPRDVALPGGDQ